MISRKCFNLKIFYKTHLHLKWLQSVNRQAITSKNRQMYPMHKVEILFSTISSFKQSNLMKDIFRFSVISRTVSSTGFLFIQRTVIWVKDSPVASDHIDSENLKGSSIYLGFSGLCFSSQSQAYSCQQSIGI